MLIGYNTNVSHKGKPYHIQTEDTGLTSANVVTLLYHEGAIIRSVKTSYSDLIGQPDLETQLRELMKRQHKEMLLALRSGTYDSPGADSQGEPAPPAGEKVRTAPEAPEAKKDQRSKSLDEILLEHISKNVKR